MLNQDFHIEVTNFLNSLDVSHLTSLDNDFGTELIQAEGGIYFKLNHISDDAGFENEKLSILAEKMSIQLIHLWEDQWQHQNRIVRSRIKAVFGKVKRMHGRETSVSKIDNNVLLHFLKENHLSVPIKGKIKLGLFYRNDLVSVISFSGPRKFLRSGKTIKSYEILRFCHKNECLVVGGLTKLLSHFVREYQPGHLMTYIDREWGSGDGFKHIGFVEDGNLSHRFFLVDKKTNRRSLPRKNQTFDVEVKKGSGDIRIYNAGSIKLIKWCR